MSTEQNKEQIKLRTEFLKFYFILFLAVVTGTLTLVVKEQTSRLQLLLIPAGFALSIVILVLIARSNKGIQRLINKLP